MFIRSENRTVVFARWLRLVSIALVLVIGLIEPLHRHTDQSVTSKTPCMLCISGHSSAPATLPNLDPERLTFAWIATEPATDSYTRPELELPFSRPPPAI